MLKYWSNAFAMTGAAMIATAFFHENLVFLGIGAGMSLLFVGAWLVDEEPKRKRRKGGKRK